MSGTKIIYVPIVECECGSRTLFDESADRYDFVCRACDRHITGAIPSPGVVGREYDPRVHDGTPQAPSDQAKQPLE